MVVTSEKKCSDTSLPFCLNHAHYMYYCWFAQTNGPPATTAPSNSRQLMTRC